MKLRIPYVLAILLSPALHAVELSCDLDGIRVGERKVSFEAPVEIVVQRAGDHPYRMLERVRDGEWFRLEKVDGQLLDNRERISLLAFGKLPKNVSDGQRYRVKGDFRDGFDFGGSARLSFHATESVFIATQQKIIPEVEPLLDLKDFDNKPVSLNGTLWSLNGFWWFSYGETDVLLGTATGRTRTFPTDWHGRQVTAQGTLRIQLRIPVKGNNGTADLKPYPVIFSAEIKLKDQSEDLNDEENRGRPLYETSPRKVDGIYDLLPEHPVRRNIVGSNSDASLYIWRNSPWFEDIVANSDPKALDIVHQRMLNKDQDIALRAIYAGILAAHNDERGRKDLRSRLEDLEPPDLDAMFVLGDLPSWLDDDSTDITWTEDLALRCFKNAPLETLLISEIPQLLVRLRSKPGIDEIINLIGDADFEKKTDLYGGWSSSNSLLLDALLVGGEDVATNRRLLSLFPSFSDDEYAQREIAEVLLERDSIEALDTLLPKITDDWWDMLFRDHAGPKILKELKKRAHTLEGEAAEAVDMILLLHSEDAVETLVARLEDPKTPINDFNRIRWQLQMLKDGSKGAVPLARFLRERLLVAKELPEFSSFLVRSAIEVIGSSDDQGAVDEMIKLLESDFSLFSSEHFPEVGFRNNVADQLAQMTGVSFGNDAEKWKNWRSKQ